MKNIVIRTNRLTLRRFRRDDIDAAFDYAGNFENTKFMLAGRQTKKECAEFIDFAINDDRAYIFAVEHSESGKLIGSAELTPLGDGNAEIVWIIHRDYWNKGYATESARALLKFGFEKLKLRRVIAHCDTKNVGSWRVMEKIGMRREGCFTEGRPAYSYAPDVHSDEFSYAILAGEYYSKKDLN